MEYPDDPEPGTRVQRTDAAFYEVYDGRAWHTEPIDERAVYGYLAIGGRDGETFRVPHRSSPADLRTAIRTVDVGDEVRVNDGNWMDVVGKDDEGFQARYQNGSVKYVVLPDYIPERINDEAGPRMFRAGSWKSMGMVGCIEVDWAERE